MPANKDLVPFKEKVIDLTPVLDSANYSIDDVLFVPVELKNVIPYASSIMDVVGLTITWNLALADVPVFTLMLFRSNPASFGALNAAVAISFADLQRRTSTIEVSDTSYKTLNSQQVKDLSGLESLVRSNGASESIWVAGVADEATTVTLVGLLNIKIHLRERSM